MFSANGCCFLSSATVSVRASGRSFSQLALRLSRNHTSLAQPPCPGTLVCSYTLSHCLQAETTSVLLEIDGNFESFAPASLRLQHCYCARGRNASQSFNGLLSSREYPAPRAYNAVRVYPGPANSRGLLPHPKCVPNQGRRRVLPSLSFDANAQACVV